MADTYSPNLRLAEFETNSHVNTWGADFITQVLRLADTAIAGYQAVDMSAGNVTLTANNGAADTSRAAFHDITATGGVTRTLTVPASSKLYFIKNNGTSRVLVKAPTGTGVEVLQGCSALVYCSGTECYRLLNSGFGIFSSLTVTATASIVLPIRPTGQAFQHARVHFDTVTNAAQNLQIEISSDGGSTYLTGAMMTLQNDTTRWGVIDLPGILANEGVYSGSATLGGGNPGVTLVPGTNLHWVRWFSVGSVGLTHVKLTLAAGGNFTGGTIRVWLG